MTIDALGCPKQIAGVLHENQAGYALALKENHESLHTQAVLMLSESQERDTGITSTTYRTQDRGHGREETRVYTAVTLNEHTSYRITQEAQAAWPGLRAIGRVVSTRTIQGQGTTQTRYYLLSDPDVKRLAQATRGHWGIENRLHWVLDVTMGEDGNRTSKDHGPENLAIIRRLALNLMRMGRGQAKRSMKKMRNMIGYRIDYLGEILNGVI